MYYCQFCNRAFEAKFSHSQHEKYYCKQNPNRQRVNRTKAYVDHKKTTCSKCGKLFDVANIKRHEASCGKIDTAYHVSHDGLNCEYCNKLCKNKNSLAQHELRCKENPDRKSFDSLVAYNKKLSSMRDTIGFNINTSTRVAKSTETLRRRYKSGELVSPMKGKPGTFTGRKHTTESKAKIRASTLSYIENLHGSVQARYNITACRYIDFINSQFNWHLQHAENGGEARVCNYFLDGYDSNLNIVFEYDEPKHYIDIENNVLCERDVERMQLIMKELNCRFIRYNERLNLLYEVADDLSWSKLQYEV